MRLSGLMYKSTKLIGWLGTPSRERVISNVTGIEYSNCYIQGEDMASLERAEVDLAKLADRLRVIAEALRRLPDSHALSPEERKPLCEEVRAIAAKLLGN